VFEERSHAFSAGVYAPRMFTIIDTTITVVGLLLLVAIPVWAVVATRRDARDRRARAAARASRLR
jgi:heme exporter protein D